ncbi:MAG: NADH-quinone oxidoreductase subunit J family protein [Acidimicrobiales bacterium]
MTGLLGGLAAASSTIHPTAADVGVFAVAAALVLSGAIGVVSSRNPVHAALMLIMTLFGVAVLFVAQHDSFLAAVQVIVYAGAIVVLFLFVIMFLGVDRRENIAHEPLRGQRPLAIGLVLLATTGLLLLGQVSGWTTGAPHVAGKAVSNQSNVALLGRSVYTTYLFPFEATAALLVIAVVGAVVLARRPSTSTRAERMVSGQGGSTGAPEEEGPGGPGASGPGQVTGSPSETSPSEVGPSETSPSETGPSETREGARP